MSDYAVTVATKAFDLAVAGFGARFKTYRKTPMLQVVPADLPLLGVYIMREQRAPMGDANHAEPRFKHALTLGFAGAVHADTENQNTLYELEQMMAELDEILLTNPHFVNLCEGVTGMDRQSQYAKIGETTLFEIRVEMVLAFSSYFPPKVVDDLNTIHVETRYPTVDADPAEIIQIIRQYELEQN